MTAYPVQLDVSSPPRFDRMQLLVRLGIAFLLGFLGISLGWVWSLLFFALPIFAAIAISTRSADFYVQTMSQRVWSALIWLLSFTAFMLLLVDRLPVDKTNLVNAEMHTTGRPTVGSALLRLVTSIPSAFVWCLLGIVSCVLWLVAFVAILFTRTVPASITSFQTGYLRWLARLVAYHASLVEEYPPFELSSRHDSRAAGHATGQLS
jgi:hypothetical protein